MTQREVERLIAGSKAFICNRCIEICSSILAEDDLFPQSPTATVFKRSAEYLIEAREQLEFVDHLIREGRSESAARVLRYVTMKTISALLLLDGDFEESPLYSEVVIDAVARYSELKKIMNTKDAVLLLDQAFLEESTITNESATSARKATEKIYSFVEENLALRKRAPKDESDS